MQNSDIKSDASFEEPTVASSYGHGWQTMKKYFIEVFIMAVIGAAATMPLFWTSKTNSPETPEISLINFFFFLYWLFLLTPIDYGIYYAYLKAVRNEQPKVNDILFSFENYVNVVLCKLVMTFIIGIGFIFFIVPGFIFASKLAFGPLLVVEKKMDVIEALKTSWQMTDGHAMTIFLMILLAILLAFLGLILLVIGIIFAFMWIDLSFASIYDKVSRLRSGNPEPEVA